jgi:hypothetical protein
MAVWLMFMPKQATVKKHFMYEHAQCLRLPITIQGMFFNMNGRQDNCGQNIVVKVIQFKENFY